MYNTIAQKLRETDKKYMLYRPDEKTLVGFSGGADSTALLHALMDYLGHDRLVAFHFNHMLRGDEAERDENFCRAFCAENKISFVSLKKDVKKLAGTASFEETARRVRYEAFSETANAYGCTTVSLAHHAGDNLETMLFHLCRGAGLSGISGIPPKRPMGDLMIVRPLIDCTREEILTYLEEHKLSYVTDSTNTDTAYTRNFIRENIIPALKEINPQAEENARKTAEIASNAAWHLQREAAAFLLPYREAKIPAETLRALSPALLYEVLAKLYQKAGGETLSAVQSAAVIDILFGKQNSRAVNLTGGIKAKLDGQNLRFFREKDEKHIRLTEKISLQEGKNPLPNGAVVYLNMCPDETLLESASFLASVKIPSESFPSLYFRARENGEGYRYGGMTRRFKKLLSGADSMAKNRPVLCDESGILWHPNFPIADRAKTESGIELFYIETKEGETSCSS